MKWSARGVLSGLALGAVLVAGLPSRGEAAPRERTPSLRSVPSAWSPLSALGEVWSAFWDWTQSPGEGRHPSDGQGSSGSTPVPPEPERKGDEGSGIDPDGKP